MKKLLKLSPLVVLGACSHTDDLPQISHWKGEPIMLDCARPRVEEYEVEFLPMLPNNPDTLIVGRFYVPEGAKLEYDNEAVVRSIKLRAAAMGGNTIVYPHHGVKEITVAYVPIEQNLHGGDEY